MQLSNAGENREGDGRHVIKSCRNLIRTEIRTLRNDLSSLRGFLRGCQDTINSETAKLEGKCLKKIESLENERVSLERKLKKLKDENSSQISASEKFKSKIRQLEKEVNSGVDEKTQLLIKVKSLDSQLGTKTQHCSDLRKKLEESKMKCLTLENKLASNEAYVKEQKEVMHEMASDNKHLEMSATDLQLRTAEAEVYEKALESHVAELEAICSILREQHDEQHNYFLQKETALKREAREKLKDSENENKRFAEQIKCLEMRLEDENMKLIQQVKVCKSTEKKLAQKEAIATNLESKLDSAMHETEIEKATVEMLMRKNKDLSEEILNLDAKLKELKDTLNVTGDGKLMDRKALAEIGNTVQEYFEGSSPLSKKLEDSLTATNNDKLEECERQLVFERQKRLSAEMEVSNLTVDLEKAKVELAIYRSNASKSARSCQERRRSLRHSAGPALRLSNSQSASVGSCNQSRQYSELLTSIPNAASSGVQNLMNGSLETSQAACDDIVNHGASFEVSVNQSARTSRSATPNLSGIVSGSEASMSLRASQKMEEARRKALAMLNNSD